MLLDEIERLEEENGALKNFQSRYYEADKQSAVLEEKLKDSFSEEIIFSVCLVIGSAILGYVPTIIGSSETTTGWVGLAFAIALIICGIASKVVKR